MGARGPKFTRTERAIIRNRVIRLHRRGKPQDQIARACGLSDRQVRHWIRVYRIAVNKRTLDDMEALLKEQIGWHQMIRDEAMDAWDESRGVREIRESEQAGEGGKPKVKLRREFNHGDAAFLREARANTEKISRLLNLNPAQRTELTGLDGGPIKVEHVDRRDERGEIRDALDRLVTGEGLSLDGARQCLIAYGMDAADVDAIYKELELVERDRERDAV